MPNAEIHRLRPVTPQEVLLTESALRQRIEEGRITAEQRALFAAELREPFRMIAHAMNLAVEALDGPDPEEAAIYAMDTAASFRQAMASLAEKLSP